MIGKLLAATDLACGKCYNKNKQEIIMQTIENIPTSFTQPIYPHQFEDLYNLAKDEDWIKKDSNNTRKNLVLKNLVAYKSYHGMASREARKGVLKYASPEGASGIIKYTCSTEQFINDTYLRLQAALSYGGALDWQEFRKKVKACKRSNSGIIAAETHLDFTWDK